MAAPAIPHGECHLHMTDAAETPGVVRLSGNILSSLVLYVKEIGMATGAVKISRMLLMGKFDITPARGCSEIKGLTQLFRERHDCIFPGK